MDLRGRKLKFTAVTALVVLALTGFSSGRSSGGSGGDGDSSGGCSSSSQNHDSSSGSRHDDDDDDYGSGGSGSTETLQDATVELVSCATEENPYAIVEVTNPNSTSDTVTVVVHFLDAQSSVVDMQTVDEVVPANDTVQVQLDLTDAAAAAQVDHCEAELMPSV